MEVLLLAVVFAVVMVAIRLKQPLSLAIFEGTLVTCLLFRIPFKDILLVTFKSVTGKSTLILVLVVYLITFLQRMMEKRNHIDLAQKSLSDLFNNRWVNCSIAPIFIGLLPSPGAVFIAGAMVDTSAGDYMTKEEKAVSTTFFRHISEAFLPTYAAIILALQLSGISAGSFVLGMMPLIIVLIVLGCIFFLRKIPTDTGNPPSENKKQDIINLFKSMWAITAIIVMIIAFNMSVEMAVIIVIALYFIVNKFTFTEIKPFFASAFETKIIVNTFAVMLFKDILTASGAIPKLPPLFAKLPIPAFLIFVILFFICTIIAGSNATIVLCLPLAFAAVPNAGMPLMVLLMSVAYAAMQLSPTHICLTLVAEHFDVSLDYIIKRTIPIMSVFIGIAILYYLALVAIF